MERKQKEAGNVKGTKIKLKRIFFFFHKISKNNNVHLTHANTFFINHSNTTLYYWYAANRWCSSPLYSKRTAFLCQKIRFLLWLINIKQKKNIRKEGSFWEVFILYNRISRVYIQFKRIQIRFPGDWERSFIKWIYCCVVFY